MGARVTIPGRISSAIILASAVRAAAAPKAHLFFQRLEYKPSASCVANSGLRREKPFLKGARHHRRLCPVEPHIQQRLLKAPPFIVG